MASPYKEVRALARGLDVLAAVNRGIRSVGEIALAVKLDRATVYRLLETLDHQGYLVKSASDGTYRPTGKVHGLSEGFRDEAWITQLAVPALGELLGAVRWPSDLATFDGRNMIALESTHRFSSLSFHRPIVARRIPMVSALGRMYVAFSAERERNKILRMLRRSEDPHEQWWKRKTEVAATLARARELGYTEVTGEVQEGIVGVAVPVLFRRRPIACINVVVIRAAMSHRDLARYVGALKNAAARIEKGLVEGVVEAPRRSPP